MFHDFKTLTWNIHGCVGLDGRYDVKRTARLIAGVSPDIAALQELDLRRKSVHQGNVLQYLCAQIGDHCHEAWALTEERGNYGQVLVSRFPMTDRTVHDISLPGYEPRNILDAVIHIPGGPIRVLTTHMGFWPVEKRRQRKSLQEIILGETSLPLLVMGDLNEWSGAGSRGYLNAVTDDSVSHRTFPSPVPMLALDRIACKGGLRIMDSGTVRDPWWASDHLPVTASIRIHKD